MRYRISRHIVFSQPERFIKSISSKYVNPSDIFLLKENGSKREFIINATIKSFIERFSGPKDFVQIVHEIAEEVKTPPAAIKKAIQPFFKYMKYRNFIVPENFCEKKTIAKRLFNQNKIIDHFRITTNIDISEQVDIYKAINLQSGNDVIIKVLKQPKKEAIEELRREFNFLTYLNETGISPKAGEFFVRKDYTYFTQDYIEGLRLPLYMNTEKASGRNAATNINFQIIKAFKIIHSKGVIHGDIHPSNIIITKNDAVKIIDFGLAINYELEKNELVNFGGAYFYMPPERIYKTSFRKFSKRPDLFSDVYQLGIILYTVLYDRYPFNGFTWEELSAEIKEKNVFFPEKSCQGFLVTDREKNIIRKCLAKNPADRFANAQQLYLSFSKNMTNNGYKIRSTIKI